MRLNRIVAVLTLGALLCGAAPAQNAVWMNYGIQPVRAVIYLERGQDVTAEEAPRFAQEQLCTVIASDRAFFAMRGLEYPDFPFAYTIVWTRQGADAASTVPDKSRTLEGKLESCPLPKISL